jgi:hypothetical protein
VPPQNRRSLRALSDIVLQKAQKSPDKRRHFQRSFVRFAFALFVPFCGYGIFENALV